MASNKPKKWYEVVPIGTKEGNEEQKVFIALARNKKYDWRSVTALSTESGVPEQRVEEILQKYEKRGIVFQKPDNEDLWGYWERVPKMIAGDKSSIATAGKKDRVEKALNPTMVTHVDQDDTAKLGGMTLHSQSLTAEKVADGYQKLGGHQIEPSDVGYVFVPMTSLGKGYVGLSEAVDNLFNFVSQECDKNLVANFLSDNQIDGLMTRYADVPFDHSNYGYIHLGDMTELPTLADENLVFVPADRQYTFEYEDAHG